MNKLVANVCAILGGVWTSLCGVLFLGLLWSVAEDPTLLSGPYRSDVTSPLLWTAVLLAVGVVIFWSGLRLMQKQQQQQQR